MPDTPIMPDIPWRKEKLEALIGGTRESVKGSRRVFLIINISCVLILVSVFNAQFSWVLNVPKRDANTRTVCEPYMRLIDGRLVFQAPSPKPELSNPKLSKETCEKAFDVYKQRALTELVWRDIYFFNVPVLGMKLMVSDLSVISSVAIIVIMTWFWFCLRRENVLMKFVVEEGKSAIKDKDWERALYLYHGVLPSYVFTTLSMDDDPKDDNPNLKGQTQWLPRFLRTMMFYLPFLTLSLVVCSDAYSLLVPWENRRWEGMLPDEKREIIWRTVFALLGMLMTWLLLRPCKHFIDDTRKKMLDFHNDLADEKILRPIADDGHQSTLG